MNSTYQQLCHNLEALKLTQMQLHLNEVADFVSVNEAVALTIENRWGEASFFRLFL